MDERQENHKPYPGNIFVPQETSAEAQKLAAAIRELEISNGHEKLVHRLSHAQAASLILAAMERFAEQKNAELRADLSRERGEIEKWRVSNNRLREEMEHQAKRANTAEWDRNEIKARADALEKELAEAKTELTRMQEAIIGVCSGSDDGRKRFESVPEMLVTLKHREQVSAESRLAAMQKHADALAGAAEALTYYTEKGHPGAPCERTGWINAEVMDEYRVALSAYRAFTAEREKENKP